MKKLYFLFLLCSLFGFSQSPGDIIITEFLNDSDAVSDTAGEWFEIYNNTGSPIDLNGWTLKDDGSNTVTFSESIVVPSMSYFVLGRGDDDPLTNGGVNLDYSYGDGVFTLGNGTDEIVLISPTTVEIDRVVYGSGNGFPDDGAGISISLDPTELAEDNNDGSNWCASTSAFGDGDLGTPGVANDVCGLICTLNLTSDSSTCDSNGPGAADDTYAVTLDFNGGNVGTTYIVSADSGTVGGDNPSMLESGTITVTGITEGTDVVITVDDTAGGGLCSLMRTITSPVCIPAACANPGDIIITEILQDAGSVSDTVGEWFEVYNTSGADIDMEGWMLTDLGTNVHTIVPSGGTTIVPANGYLVLGRSTDMLENGGAPVDYAWTDYTLSNSDDEIIISCGAAEIDRVEYTGSSPWPDPTGSSMELAITSFNSTDNDFGSNWGVATTPFGDGDNGTPGGDNDYTLSTSQLDINSFSIYPNPVSDGFLNIRKNNSDAINVVVYDVLGKQISKTRLANNQPLNVSELKSGLYILQISQNETSISKKLIIK